ncbi:MAG TPA: NAD(+)/NADH kinase [Candidatus Thermoplasmatota archaeon]|nr:NAD(+)/NADH kinase [Candidatus Thermoplasmatota archaeon]
MGPAPGAASAPAPASAAPVAGRPARLRVGLVVNPVAGLGGPGAYKGSDGNWQDALAEGYQPTSPARARRFVQECGADLHWVAAPGLLGADYAPGCQVVLAEMKPELGKTTRDDTMRAAAAIRDAKVDLLCFLGGDGTAADVCKAVGDKQACLGVPAGVKITSAVFAHDVEEAAWLVERLRPGFETILRDVTDLDEVAYRTGHVDIELKGNLRVPMSPAIQSGKVATSTDTPLEPLIEQLLQEWDADALHLVGAGSVCLAVKDQFWGKPTLLGVDAIQGSRITAIDLDDRQIADLVEKQLAAGGNVRVVLSTIGGQGMLLGRGTQMFRPEVLKKIGWDSLRVVAPPEKLLGLRALHVDTGDPEFDLTAPKHIRVTTGWNESRMMRLVHGAAKAEEREAAGTAATAAAGNGSGRPMLRGDLPR